MSKTSNRFAILILGALICFVMAGGIGLKNSQSLTVKGVPVPVLVKFLSDPSALNLYFSGNKVGLHNRLQQLGVEEDIKAFYRPKIQDELQLDQYIHQVFYNLSGYVGAAYYVNPQGLLILKSAPEPEFQKWFKLASKAGIVVASERKNGIYYVISPQGAKAPYQEIAAIFPLSDLQRLLETTHK
jgi:hypothetical protein